MRINIVYAAAYQSLSADLASRLKNIGPTWGSWRTWSTCNTDNVVCHDLGRARELHQRAIQALCNFYIPEKFYQAMQRPARVNLYQGDFTHDTTDIEDVICMHLVAESSDIVLLFGFDLANPGMPSDVMELHRLTNRFGLIRQVMASADQVQWILVDHDQSPDKAFASLPNVTCDNMENVLELLG
jgi:hypothetical protein